MAIVYALKSGNWSDPTVWNTGSLPGTGDEVRSNSFTVTIDGDYTVLSLSNKSETSPVVASGGSFPLNAGVTFTATSFSRSVTGNLITFSAASPATATVNSRFDLGGGSARTIINSSSGTLNLNGNIYPFTSGAPSPSLLNSGSGVINLVGNVEGTGWNGGFSDDCGIYNSGTGTINITGNVYTTSISGVGAYAGAVNASVGAINVVGQCINRQATHSSGKPALRNMGAGRVSLTGNAVTTTGVASPGAIGNESTGTGTIFGNISGEGATGSGCAVSNASSGTLIHSGSVIASSFFPQLVGGSTSSNTCLTGPFISASNGMQAIAVPRWLWKQTNQQPTYMEVRTETSLALRPLYTADYVGGNPSVSNVRSGTVYGPANELTGTMAVPSANSVGAGVPVDNTVGTQTVSITPADFWSVASSSLTSSGSIGERLKNASTVASVAAQVISLK